MLANTLFRPPVPQPHRPHEHHCLDLAAFDAAAGDARHLPRDVQVVRSRAELYNSGTRRAQLAFVREALEAVCWWSWLRHRHALDLLQREVEREQRSQLRDAFRWGVVQAAQCRHYADTLAGYDLSQLRTPIPGPLTEDEKDALSRYMQPGGSQSVNRALRGQVPMTYQTYAQALYMLRGLARLPDVTRGTCPPKSVWRGTSHFPGGVADPAGLTVGATCREPAFLSSSETRTGILPGRYLIRLDQPVHGRDVSPYGLAETNDLEREVLFPPGTVFRYLGFDSEHQEYVFSSDSSCRLGAPTFHVVTRQ